MTIKPSVDTTAAPTWIKSSYSSNEGPDCVEIAATPGTVHIRDSKNPQGPLLTFAHAEWSAFLSITSDRA
ncbi:DUF397 domain-containing protein [Streptomyces sp. NPDC051561]|uniref:DUF397 domain-containing protein n=1 Tax=Streptomyces sp. NPDC051561 TaxID=3365658 RepID=UPI0037AF12AB